MAKLKSSLLVVAFSAIALLLTVLHGGAFQSLQPDLPRRSPQPVRVPVSLSVSPPPSTAPVPASNPSTRTPAPSPVSFTVTTLKPATSKPATLRPASPQPKPTAPSPKPKAPRVVPKFTNGPAQPVWTSPWSVTPPPDAPPGVLMPTDLYKVRARHAAPPRFSFDGIVRRPHPTHRLEELGPPNARAYCELLILHTRQCFGRETFEQCVGRLGPERVAVALGERCVRTRFFRSVLRKLNADPAIIRALDGPSDNSSKTAAEFLDEYVARYDDGGVLRERFVPPFVPPRNTTQVVNVTKAKDGSWSVGLPPGTIFSKPQPISGTDTVMRARVLRRTNQSEIDAARAVFRDGVLNAEAAKEPREKLFEGATIDVATVYADAVRAGRLNVTSPRDVAPDAPKPSPADGGRLHRGMVPESWRAPPGAAAPPYVPPEQRPNAAAALYPAPKVFLHHKLNISCPVHRIGMGIPEENIVDRVDRTKLFDFVPYPPSKFGYAYGGPAGRYTLGRNDEVVYYELNRRSLFGFTHRRGCWSSQRGFDLLAAGSVPIFVDQHHALDPIDAIPLWPWDLLEEARSLPGIVNMTKGNLWSAFMSKWEPWVTHFVVNFRRPGAVVDWNQFDFERYYSVADRLLAFTKANLTTTVQATHFLRVMRKPAAKHVIVFHLQWYPEITSLVHGLLRLGLRVSHRVVHPDAHLMTKVRNMTERELYRWRKRYVPIGHRSNGFSYGFRGDPQRFDICTDVDVPTRPRCQHLLTARQPDLVVYSGYGPTLKGDAKTRWPHWDLVKQHYRKEEIALIDGDDFVGYLRPTAHKHAGGIIPCRAGIAFARESADGGRGTPQHTPAPPDMPWPPA